MEQLPGIVIKFSEDSNHMLRRINLTEDAILNRLKKLKVNKASGVDNIVPRLMAENAECLSKLRLLIFSESVGRDIVPKHCYCNI
jgi:hypothetical protein